MQKRASTLVAPILALVLVAAAAISFAQDDKNAKSNTTTYRTDTTYYDTGMPSGSVKLMTVITDKGFTHQDLVKILPLLQDLRDARTECDAKRSEIYTDLVLNQRHRTNAFSETSLKDCDRALADRQRSIWNTITDRVGADKANALLDIVEPKTEEVSKIVYTNTRLQRIDSMIQDLDKMAAARIAANGGTPQSGVVVASTETVTTTTREVPPMITSITMPPLIDERDLVKAIEERIVADEIGNSEYLMFIPQTKDLTSSDITFLREGHMKVWW